MANIAAHAAALRGSLSGYTDEHLADVVAQCQTDLDNLTQGSEMWREAAAYLEAARAEQRERAQRQQ